MVGWGMGMVIPGCLAVVGTYIFGFVVPNLVSVAIFVENRAFFNFGAVGCVGSARSSHPSTLHNTIVCKIIVRCVSLFTS